jgi:tripartite-type tricarboxylate transporter receptor subunit TctC
MTPDGRDLHQSVIRYLSSVGKRYVTRPLLPILRLPGRRFLQLGGVVLAPALVCGAVAQTYPSRPITMIIPFPPGGNVDVVGRVLAERMRGPLGQPIIIENIAGANGSIGVGRTARAQPDGYTIDLGFLGGHVQNGALYSLSYDVLNDFEPITPLVATPYVIFARKTMPANDLTELIAWLKANSDKASAAIVTVGVQLITALFQKQTGTQFALVPYRGTAPAMQDLVAGQIDMSFDLPVQLPLMRAGSIKAYAVTSEMRLMTAPDIPTVGEMGLPALYSSTWFAFFAPKGTPMGIVGKLNAAAVDALADAAVRSRFNALGLEIFPRKQQTPEALGALVKADAEKWWPIIKESGIKLE